MSSYQHTDVLEGHSVVNDDSFQQLSPNKFRGRSHSLLGLRVQALLKFEQGDSGRPLLLCLEIQAAL